VVGKALKEESTQPRKTPYVTHEERISAEWHIFYNTREKGRAAPQDAPARRRRAMGRIEHALLVGELSARPNRPKTFARNPTVPPKVTKVSIYGEGRKPRGVKTSRALGFHYDAHSASSPSTNRPDLPSAHWLC
jgi:hypothetical protein